MDLPYRNSITPVKRPCHQTGRDHSYIKDPVHEGHAQHGDNNLQLVHLLTTNPAAALPAIFPGSGNQSQVNFRPKYRFLNCPRISSASNSYRWENNYSVLDGRRIMVNTWAVNKMNERVPLGSQRSFSELYVSKEEMDKKACCLDNEGNFNFDALLPAVYWRPQEENFTLLSDI